MVPLTLADPGREAVILRVGGNDQARKHLEALGFVPGGSVAVVSATGGNLIVSVKNSRVALSREMAQKIMV